MHNWNTLAFAIALGATPYVATAQDDLNLGSAVEFSPRAVVASPDIAKPDVGEQIYAEGVRWNTVVKQVEIRIADETPLRKQLAILQGQYASLFTGVELVDLIERTKADIQEREAVLTERASSFDARMVDIRKQLEELRRSAVAVGVGDELEAMIESAGNAADMKGLRGPGLPAQQKQQSNGLLKTEPIHSVNPFRGNQQRGGSQSGSFVKPF